MGKIKLISKQEMDEVIKLYQEGKNALEISNIFGISKTYVYNILRRNNIKRRSTSEYLKKWWNEHPEKKINRYKGETNPHWKGDNVGIYGLHMWLRKHKPKPEFCERCKIRPPKELSNNSKQYTRDINDYEWLCKLCHNHKDHVILLNPEKVRYIRSSSKRNVDLAKEMGLNHKHICAVRKKEIWKWVE